MAEAQIAVLIDYENVGLGSMQYLFDQLSDVGRVIVKRAYADWSAGGKHREQVLELGIEAVHHFRAAGSAKNSSDISLAVDAVELLHTSPVDTFVIVSADSDFVSLVSKLRAAGKTVIGAGRQDVVSSTLVKSCDRYIYLDSSSQRKGGTSGAREQPVESLLARAMEASTDSQGRVPGSKLHQAITRIDPSFDFKARGFQTFTQFLEAFPVVRVTRSRGPGDVQVELGTSEATDGSTGMPPESNSWAAAIHAAWSAKARKAGDTIAGPQASGDAAQILGTPKLSASQFKTLQKLLEASPVLSQNWSRSGNTLHRR